MNRCISVGADGEFVGGLVKPVVVDVGLLFGDASDDDGGFGAEEGVVVDIHIGACDGGAVFSVAASVHVKTVAEGLAEFDVVAGFVSTAWATSAGYRVSVGVEEVVGNARF